MYIALSPLHKLHPDHQDWMFGGLDYLNSQLKFPMGEIDRRLAQAILDSDASILSEIWKVQMAFCILPMVEELNILQNTPFTKAMGKVEQWCWGLEKN